MLPPRRVLTASDSRNNKTGSVGRRPKAGLLLGFIDGQPVCMSPRARSLPTILVGAAGTGKTTCMEAGIRQDIDASRGACVIDPMGALVKRLLDYYCYRKAIGCRVPKIKVFDPSSGEWILPYNPFVRRSGDLAVQVDRRVQAVLRVWRQHGSDETPRLEKWLRAIFTVLIEGNLTILEAEHLITLHADELRAFFLRAVTDSLIRSRLEQLEHYKPSDFLMHLESAENRLMRFLTSTTIRRTMGTGANALDFRTIMDDGELLLVNLQPSDWLSLEQQRLFGTLLLTEFFETALTRPTGARPYYLWVDEAARFVTPELGMAFETCRQKGLHLVLAFQPSRLPHHRTRVSGQRVGVARRWAVVAAAVVSRETAVYRSRPHPWPELSRTDRPFHPD